MPPAPETARFWRSPLLPGADMLTARYTRHAFAPHWHEGYVIAAITAGAERYRYRGLEHVAPRGTLAVINPGEIHTGESAAPDGWSYRVFYPSAETLARLARGLHPDWSRGGTAVSGPGLAPGLLPAPGASHAPLRPGSGDLPWFPDRVIEDPELCAALARAHRLLEDGTAPLAAETLLVTALTRLIARHGRTRPLDPDAAPAARPGVVEAMRARLAQDLAEPLTLSELAQGVGLSPFHAARTFSRAVGLPPHAWRTQARLSAAVELMRRGATATEAAAATGFSDQSHFTRHFKRAYGVPPGLWRGR
jgi:AraC-like DNA-binding protein